MKTLACGFLLAALAGTAQAGPGDDMQFLPEALPVLAWSNCIPGTTCTVLRARDCPTQAWEAVDSVVATSGVTEIPLPAGIEPRPGDVVRAVVTHGAPHHLVADSALRTGHLPVRRTRAGDVWEARRAEPAPETRVTLGVPTVRR